LNFYIILFAKWCIRLPNLSWGKFFGGFTVYCYRTVNYDRIYPLLLWCTQQLIIDLPYCWFALQYIEESSSFIDWQFGCLFICLMLKKCLSKCHDKLAAKHLVLFCLASITMLQNCSSINRSIHVLISFSWDTS
jgi:hypothetical protein